MWLTRFFQTWGCQIYQRGCWSSRTSMSQGALMPVLPSGFHFQLRCRHSEHNVHPLNHCLLFLSLSLSLHALPPDAMPIPDPHTLPLILQICLIHLDALLQLCSSCFFIWHLLYLWLTFCCCGWSAHPKNTVYPQVSPFLRGIILPRLFPYNNWQSCAHRRTLMSLEPLIFDCTM